jgi:hypothetical protein
MKKVGSRKPLTVRGLRRKKCFCCKERPARFQWSACAINSYYIAVCEHCDIHLNMVMLTAIGVPDTHKRIKQYEERVKHYLQ